MRQITRFESPDGVTVASLVLGNREVESTQEFRAALEPAVGMGYAVDLHGQSPAPLGVGQERMRALLFGRTQADVDAKADELRRVIGAIGQGRLWSVGADGGERWAWARPLRMPDVTISHERTFTAPVVLEFARLSDWFAATDTVVTATITASPSTVLVTNDGTAPARDIVFLLEAHAANGYAAPRITNSLTGETFATSRVAGSALARWRVDTGRYAVESSEDGGATWLNDYAAFTTGATQVGFLRLLPGDQTLTVTGVTNATLTIRFYAPYR